MEKNSKPYVKVDTSQGEKTFAAEEISAMVLAKMKETAEVIFIIIVIIIIIYFVICFENVSN